MQLTVLLRTVVCLPLYAASTNRQVTFLTTSYYSYILSFLPFSYRFYIHSYPLLPFLQILVLTVFLPLYCLPPFCSLMSYFGRSSAFPLYAASTNRPLTVSYIYISYLFLLFLTFLPFLSFLSFLTCLTVITFLTALHYTFFTCTVLLPYATCCLTSDGRLPSPVYSVLQPSAYISYISYIYLTFLTAITFLVLYIILFTYG